MGIYNLNNMFYKFTLGFISAISVFQVVPPANAFFADSVEPNAILILPAPQVHRNNYQKLIDSFTKRVALNDLGLTMVKMPDSYNYDYNPEEEIERSLSQFMFNGDKRVLL